MFEHPGAMAGAPVPWAELGRILVVRPDNLGDVLLAGPAVAALRAAAPRAALELLASPAGAGAAALLPAVDHTVMARVSWQQLAAGAGGQPPDAELEGALRARGYDAAIVLTSFSQSPWPAGYLLQRAGVPVRAGTSAEFGGAVLTHWVPAPDPGLHQVDRALHVLERIGVPPTERTLAAQVPPGGRAAARARLAGAGIDPDASYVVLLPGASCSARRYPAERFRQVARLVAATGRPVVVSGPARERELVAAVAAAGPGVVGLPGALDVAGLAGLLAGAAVVVANNSGGMHLADAVGTPVVALFAGTEDPAQFRPRSVPAQLLTRPTWCRPCRQLTCPFGQECLDVPPSEVVAAVEALVAGAAVNPRAARPPGGDRRPTGSGPAASSPTAGGKRPTAGSRPRHGGP